MRQREKEETALFQIGWALTGIVLFVWVFLQIFPLPISKLMLPCIVHSILGIYCPGCGGTRAVLTFFHGKFLTSFICHPIILYTAVVGGWFLISQSVDRISKHRIPIGMKYHDAYVWIALGIVIVNFIIKNALLLIWHIDLLENIPL